MPQIAEMPQYIETEGFVLEARLHTQPGHRAVVVTHPHPLYGGDMDNPVVTSMVSAYATAGLTTLRFNFRGVGANRDHHGRETGAQGDVEAAYAFLQSAGYREIHLAGYSFGAWINACVGGDRLQPAGMVMVAPPLTLLDFAGVDSLRALHLVVVGDQDQWAPLPALRRHMARWNPAAKLEVLPSADHFFSGRLPALRQRLKLHLG